MAIVHPERKIPLPTVEKIIFIGTEHTTEGSKVSANALKEIVRQELKVGNKPVVIVENYPYTEEAARALLNFLRGEPPSLELFPLIDNLPIIDALKEILAKGIEVQIIDAPLLPSFAVRIQNPLLDSLYVPPIMLIANPMETIATLQKEKENTLGASSLTFLMKGILDSATESIVRDIVIVQKIERLLKSLEPSKRERISLVLHYGLLHIFILNLLSQRIRTIKPVQIPTLSFAEASVMPGGGVRTALPHLRALLRIKEAFFAQPERVRRSERELTTKGLNQGYESVWKEVVSVMESDNSLYLEIARGALFSLILTALHIEIEEIGEFKKIAINPEKLHVNKKREKEAKKLSVFCNSLSLREIENVIEKIIQRIIQRIKNVVDKTQRTKKSTPYTTVKKIILEVYKEEREKRKRKNA